MATALCLCEMTSQVACAVAEYVFCAPDGHGPASIDAVTETGGKSLNIELLGAQRTHLESISSI